MDRGAWQATDHGVAKSWLALPVERFQSQRVVLLTACNHLPLVSWSNQYSFSACEARTCSIPFVSDAQCGSLRHNCYFAPDAMWTLPQRDRDAQS